MIDDMLPRHVDEASRHRETVAWTGDVFKVGTVLEKYRTDLTVVWVDTEPTGVMLVVGLNSDDTTLHDQYEQIVADQVTPDPQLVPAEILHRSHAADPERVLASGFWADLRTARDSDALPANVDRELRGLSATATYLAPPADAPAPKRLTGAPSRLAPPKGPRAAGARKRQPGRSAPPRKRGLVHRIRKAVKRRL
jgi:hypothetical protein